VHALSLRAAAALAAGAVIASAPLAPLAAQETPRPTFGLAGGISFPTGDFGSGFKSGYDISAFVGFHPATSPVGLRLEGMYDRFDADGNNPLGIHRNVFAGTGNVILGGTAAPGSIRPYVIAGLGFYNLKVDATNASGASSSTKFGINGGAGLELPLSGITALLEARIHYVFANNGNTALGYNATFIPVVVGVRF
jgi:hypothetical protein